MVSSFILFLRRTIVVILCFLLAGCAASIPKDILKLSPQSLEKRQLQMRQYDTTNEEMILSACVGVLQDLGFTLDDSETEVGLISASKERDATDGGQVAAATFVTILAALGGSSSDVLQEIDDIQKIRISVVSRLSLDGKRTIVRVTFQRIVWNKRGEISRIETLDDPELYEGFFEKLSKAIFLEAHKI